MDKEQEALKNFLGNLGGNEEAELNLGQEIQEEIPEVINEEQGEEKIPFHKNPKLDKYLSRREAKIREELKKEFQSSRQEQFSQEVQEDDSLISAFEAIIGNDTPEKVHALKQLKKSIADTQDKAAEKAYARFAEESREIQLQEAQAVEELTDGLDRIEENFNVDLSSNSPLAKKTRNDFLDFLGRISPKNEYGEVTEYADIEEAFETFQSIRKPQNSNQAKQIASRAVARSVGDGTQTQTKRITFENWKELAGLENN